MTCTDVLTLTAGTPAAEAPSGDGPAVDASAADAPPDLDELAVTSPEALAEVATEELEAEVVTYSAHLAAATCRFLVLLAEFDRREGWAGFGTKSCAHWMCWRLGIDIHTGREQLRVGKALLTLPAIRTAFARGRLTYSKVRALTRVATDRNEVRLLELALEATASQLETICRAYRSVLDLDDADGSKQAVLAQERRHLRWYRTRHGTVVIEAELPVELASVVTSRIEELVDRERDEEQEDQQARAGEAAGDVPAGTSGTGTTLEQARADALVELARGEWRQGEDPARPLVALHLDEGLAEGRKEEGCCHLEGLGTIGLATAKRLTCDARIRRYRATTNGTFDLVGETREVPRRLRRALLLRDGGCRFPRCPSTRRLHAHHVVFVTDGGPTVLDNLVLLCSRHHHLVHEGGHHLALGQDASVSVTAPDGTVLEETVPRTVATGAGLRQRQRERGFVPTPDDVPITGGDELDLDLTITALRSADWSDERRAAGVTT